MNEDFLSKEAWSGERASVGDSSCIASAGYSKGELEIEFTDGQVYTYSGVPTLVYANFLRTNSKGWFFNKYIRNRYSAR